MRNRLKENALVQKTLLAPMGRFEVLFTLVLLLFVGILLWTTLDYSQYGKIIPLIVGIPTFTFLITTLLGQTSNRLEAILDRFRLDDVLDMSDSISEMDDDGSEESQPLIERRVQLLVISGWILALTAMFHYAGIKNALAAFLPGYYYFEADLSLLRTVGYSAVIWTFIYGVFEVILGTPL